MQVLLKMYSFYAISPIILFHYCSSFRLSIEWVSKLTIKLLLREQKAGGVAVSGDNNQISLHCNHC